MKIRWYLPLAAFTLLIFLTACGGNNEEPIPEPTSPPVVEPTATPIPPVPTATSDPYANIQHNELPGQPTFTYWAADCNTGIYTTSLDSPNIGAGCNDWALNFIERPTGPAEDLYHPQLDITIFQMGKDETWLFADITTFSNEENAAALDGTYAAELDFNVDGNGDVLVMVTNPSLYPAGEWHVEGVQVWEDTNDDVGGETPVLADDQNPGDGYETLVFDQGLGQDPDFAWARISPDNPGTVELAVKREIIPGGVGAFLWWTWASQEQLDPGLFDYVDTYDSDEVHLIENTCRWIFDGPSQPLTNICYYEEKVAEPRGRNEPTPIACTGWISVQSTCEAAGGTYNPSPPAAHLYCTCP